MNNLDKQRLNKFIVKEMENIKNDFQRFGETYCLERDEEFNTIFNEVVDFLDIQKKKIL